MRQMAGPVKILEVITLGEVGGAQAVLIDLVKGLILGGYNVEIDVLCGKGDFVPSQLENLPDVRVIRSKHLQRKISLVSDAQAFKEIADLCRQRKYNIVHCHSSKASFIGRLAGLLTSIPRVCVTVHGISFPPYHSSVSRSLHKGLEKLLFPLNVEYVFVSPDDLNIMTSMGLDAAKCIVIPNGRSVPRRPEKILKELLNIDHKKPLILMVGRLSEQKNPQSFVRMTKKVIEIFPADMPAPCFVMIGTGPLYDECQRLVAAEQLDSHVYLAGAVEEAGRYFWDADVAVLTSYYEACPLVIIEALATGTPVVASDVEGTRHVVRHMETGYLFPLNDEVQGAEKVVRILRDDKLRRNMKKAALEDYKKRYTLDRMIKEYAAFFNLSNR